MVDLPAPPARSDLFPPSSFPVYGLVSPFDGARCLELFGDPPEWRACLTKNSHSGGQRNGTRTSCSS